MKESAKRLWAARLLALVVMSAGLSLLVSISPENKPAYKKRVEIRARGNIGEIVSAVEKLGRDDIHIKAGNGRWYERKPRFLWTTAGFFGLIGICLAIYHTIYCLINGLLGLIKEDDCELESRLTDDFIEPSP